MDVVGHPCATATKPPPFISFAQNFEDVMLWRALRHIESGFYIDIGAGDPEADSVTKAFYDRTWSGINVEPAAGSFGRLAEARPRDRNLRVLVGENEGARQFFLIDGGNGLSTAVPELAASHGAAGWEFQTVLVPGTTLTNICDQHVRGQIHFLKLDAEWSELAILRGADFDRFRPWIVVFEATPIGMGPNSYLDCDAVLEQAGYQFVYADGLNRFWVAGERHAELAPHFVVPPNVFDSFVRASEMTARAQAAAAQEELARMTAALAETRRLEAAAQDELARAAQAAARNEAAARDEAAVLQSELAAARKLLLDQVELQQRAAESAATAVTAAAAAEAAHAQAIATEASAESAAAAAKTRLDRAIFERDAAAQELYETNRYAAALTVERQILLERVGTLTAEAAHLVHAEVQAQERARMLQIWLDAVYASTSWKFAWPVRAARRLLPGGRR